MKKLAIALCIISTQAFGMEYKQPKPKLFRNLAQLQAHLVGELNEGRLKPNIFNFAYHMLTDAAHHIKRETKQRGTHTFAYMLEREETFLKKFEQDTIKYVEQVIETKKKRKTI
jgi:hypothetical protein